MDVSVITVHNLLTMFVECGAGPNVNRTQSEQAMGHTQWVDGRMGYFVGWVMCYGSMYVDL